jgi:hypothetical protein
MGLTLYNLFKSGLLVANAAAVLHEKRFLVTGRCTFPISKSRLS